MYLYLTADSVYCDGTIAWATPCLFDPITNQPRAGAANFCPGSVYLLSTDRETAIATLLHEMTHALVRLHCCR